MIVALLFEGFRDMLFQIQILYKVAIQCIRFVFKKLYFYIKKSYYSYNLAI